MLSLIPLVCWNPWILVKLTLLAQKLPLLVNLGYKVRRNHWRDVPRLHLCFKCQETYMEKFVACTIQFCKPPNRQLYSKHFLLWDGRRKRSAPTFSPPSSLMEIVITGNYRNTNKKALRSCKKKTEKRWGDTCQIRLSPSMAASEGNLSCSRHHQTGQPIWLVRVQYLAARRWSRGLPKGLSRAHTHTLKQQVVHISPQETRMARGIWRQEGAVSNKASTGFSLFILEKMSLLYINL